MAGGSITPKGCESTLTTEEGRKAPRPNPSGRIGLEGLSIQNLRSYALDKVEFVALLYGGIGLSIRETAPYRVMDLIYSG